MSILQHPSRTKKRRQFQCQVEDGEGDEEETGDQFFTLGRRPGKFNGTESVTEKLCYMS